MRKLPVLMVTASTVALGVAAIAFWAFSDPKPADTAQRVDSELTTGTIDARWPKPGVERQAALEAPAVQPPATAPQAAEKRPVQASQVCRNPNALGVSRTVQIDTSGGPGFGMSQYRDYDFLEPGEVILTFDDGPWPVSTPAVLNALDAECTKALFFPIGKHASWHPEVLKQVIAHGHTVGSHTWSHHNLASKSPQEARDEIEKGMSAVAAMAGTQIAPFFRFPQLRQTADLKAYLGERNVAAFSIDIDSEDFKIKKPDVLVTSVMTKLKKKGKGIILMHDLHRWTATALPEILGQLKAGGYKVVHVKAKEPLTTLPAYDTMMTSQLPAKSNNARAISAVVQNVD